MAQRIAAFCFVFVFPLLVWSKMPTNPVDDADFMKLPDGRDLAKVSVSGVPLFLTQGAGQSFGATELAAFKALVQNTQKKDYPVQWALMDLDSHKLLGESAESTRKIFGASTSKVFVAATLNDKLNGKLGDSQFQLLADMQVVSSNTAWVELQTEIGNGDADMGRAAIYEFTQNMGYMQTRGWQGYWGDLHGNELVASELVEFLFDTYHANYDGAETVWKLMHTYRTGAHRGNKYIPQDIFVGGKTGTYDGPSVDPATGKDTNADGSPYTVKVRNQIIVFHLNGHEYGLAVLANDGLDESAALLAGGFYRSLLTSSRLLRTR